MIGNTDFFNMSQGQSVSFFVLYFKELKTKLHILKILPVKKMSLKLAISHLKYCYVILGSYVGLGADDLI